MRHAVIAAVTGLLISATTSADDAARVAASREAVKRFATELKGELMQAMNAGGPVNAIGVCKVVAPEIAQRISSAHGFEVARTSLRVRNPDNAPDAWEREVLEEFVMRRQAGADPATLEHHEIVGEGDQRRFRYMKAIPTAELCVTCHGAKLAPEVREALAREYPQDEAVGFSVGEIRGAFTITQPM